MSEPLRVMRDYVYGERSTDINWDGCRECWKEWEIWLTRRFNALPRPLPPYKSLPFPKTHQLPHQPD